MVHEPLTGALRITVVAVMVPVASLLPVAVMHMPGMMFASVPVLVWVMVVVDASVTVASPVLLLRISVDPLIWHQLAEGGVSCEPAAATGRRRRGWVEPPAAVALPHAATPRAVTTPAAPRNIRFMRIFLPTG